MSVSIRVTDEALEPMSVRIQVLDNETKEDVKSLESNNSGTAQVKLEKGKSYLFYFTTNGYLFQSAVLTVPDSAIEKKKLKDIVMPKLEAGKKTILNAVAFDVYQKLMIEESMPDMDRVVKLLTDIPSLEVELGGYTDNIGSVTLNRKISEQRVQLFAEMLVSKGINEARIKYKGYGPNQPIATNFTEEGRQMNNRVELKILSTNFVPPTASQLKKQKNKTPKTETKEDDPSQDDPDTNEGGGDTVKVDNTVIDPRTITAKDTLLKIDYKGMLIADKKPMSNSTVNLLTEQGKIYKTTRTDEKGNFEFVGLPAEQDLTIGLDAQETKQFKKVVLADTTGNVVKELEKINGEFVLTILPSEKQKLGKVYVDDPELVLKRPKKKTLKANALVIGKVVDEKGNPLRADIDAVDYTSGLTVQKISSSNSTGEFSLTLPVGKSYDITFSKFGYTFQTLNVGIPEIADYQKNMEEVALQKVEAGKKIVLNNIFFDVNQATLRKESYAELARALKLMNDISSMTIEISGHTDNVGSDKSNKALSEQRAKAVVDYLILNGANKDKLTFKGYGASKPIANNKTEAGRQLNRRTEFKVLKVDEAEIKNKEASIEASAAGTDSKGEGDTESNSREENNTSSAGVPERYKKYDTDNDGVISYEEVIIAIDSYFDEHPNGNAQVKDELNGLFDYYFEK